MDLVITGPGGGVRWSQDLRSVFKGQAGDQVLFELKAPRREARPRYTRFEGPTTISGSGPPDSLRTLLDRDPDTVWSPTRPLARGDWVELAWIEPVPLARIELRIANRPDRNTSFRILTRGADGVYRLRTAIPAREPVQQQVAAGRPMSQVFLIDPEPVSALRLDVEAAPAQAWVLSELELSVRVPPPAQR